MKVKEVMTGTPYFDRDICVALATRNQTAGQVLVEEVVQRAVYACNPQDDIDVALQRNMCGSRWISELAWCRGSENADRTVSRV